MDQTDLNLLREKIERLNKFNQVQILSIFASHEKDVINENKNGIHINLSEVTKETIDRVVLYLQYLDKQESALDVVEKQKGELKNTYFSTSSSSSLSSSCLAAAAASESSSAVVSI